jgi:hypothetical protein
MFKRFFTFFVLSFIFASILEAQSVVFRKDRFTSGYWLYYIDLNLVTTGGADIASIIYVDDITAFSFQGKIATTTQISAYPLSTIKTVFKTTGPNPAIISTFTTVVPPQFDTQTLTASPLTGVLAVGQSLNGQALGSKDGSLYTITKTGGGSSGSININANTGVYVITASTIGGPLTFDIQISAGNGLSASNVLSGSVQITEAAILDPSAPKKTLPVTINNPTNGDLIVQAVDSITGVIYGTYTLKPGETQINTITKTSSSSVNLIYTLKTDTTNQVLMTDGTISDALFIAGTQYANHVISDSDFNSSTTVFQKPKTLLPNVTAQPVSITPSTSTSVQNIVPKVTTANPSSIGFTTAPPITTTGTLDSTTREGLSAVVTELQQINSRDEKTNTDKIKQLETEKKLVDDANALAVSQRSQASSDMSSKIPVGGSFPSPPVIISGGYQDFTIKMPAIFGGMTVDLDPLRDDRFGPTASWLRSAFSWLAIITFGVWSSAKVGDWVKGASQLQQTKGNTVAGTGGQITASIGAGIIVVILSTFIVSLVSYLSGDFSIASIISKSSTNPTVGMGAKALYLLDGLFPIATIVTALVARIFWNLYASSIFAGAMAAIRFVNP